MPETPRVPSGKPGPRPAAKVTESPRGPCNRGAGPEFCPRFQSRTRRRLRWFAVPGVHLLGPDVTDPALARRSRDGRRACVGLLRGARGCVARPPPRRPYSDRGHGAQSRYRVPFLRPLLSEPGHATARRIRQPHRPSPAGRPEGERQQRLPRRGLRAMARPVVVSVRAAACECNRARENRGRGGPAGPHRGASPSDRRRGRGAVDRAAIEAKALARDRRCAARAHRRGARRPALRCA